mgnify:CR=1 FL=1
MSSETACKHFSMERRSPGAGVPPTIMNICTLKDNDLELRQKLHAIHLNKGIAGNFPGPSCPPKCWKDKQWELCPLYEPA